MAKYIIAENVTHFHEIECDDELDIERVLFKARHDLHRFDTGYEAIEGVLDGYAKRYGFEYSVTPNACGTETVNMDLYDEVE